MCRFRYFLLVHLKICKHEFIILALCSTPMSFVRLEQQLLVFYHLDSYNSFKFIFNVFGFEIELSDISFQYC